MDKIKFADRLTDLRKAQHMTQADLAKKLNISPQAVSKWETGGIYTRYRNARIIS